MKKLSSAQIRVLKAFAEPGAEARYMTGPNGGYYQLGTKAIKLKIIQQLIRLGLLVKRLPGWSITVTITTAGRDALAELEKEDK